MHPQERPSDISQPDYKHPDLMDNAEERLILKPGESMSLATARDKMCNAYQSTGNAPHRTQPNGFDADLLDTAVREFKEENALDIAKEELKCTVIQPGVNGFVPLIHGEYRLEKNVDQLPNVKPDGIEIDKLVFVKISALRPEGDGFTYKDPTDGNQYTITKPQRDLLQRALEASAGSGSIT